MGQIAGMGIAAGGALAVLLGAALPWARFTVVGVAVGVPGLMSVWGWAAAAIGLLSLSAAVRRWPLVGVLLGVAALILGGAASHAAGRLVVERLLAAANTLAPINAKLAQAGLPPIEPFGGSIGVWSAYVGPGPVWTLWGGGTVALGSAVQFAAARLARTCRRCGSRWRADRDVAFCPHCGAQQDTCRHCGHCGAVLERRDHFCAACGAAAGKP